LEPSYQTPGFGVLCAENLPLGILLSEEGKQNFLDNDPKT
jgi:hypothetical protein